jgi:hypothetical protein
MMICEGEEWRGKNPPSIPSFHGRTGSFSKGEMAINPAVKPKII